MVLFHYLSLEVSANSFDILDKEQVGKISGKIGNERGINSQTISVDDAGLF